MIELSENLTPRWVNGERRLRSTETDSASGCTTSLGLICAHIKQARPQEAGEHHEIYSGERSSHKTVNHQHLRATK